MCDVKVRLVTRTWIPVESCGRVRQRCVVYLQTELGKYQKAQLRAFSACEDGIRVCVFHHVECSIYCIQSFPSVMIYLTF